MKAVIEKYQWMDSIRTIGKKVLEQHAYRIKRQDQSMADIGTLLSQF